MSELSERDKLEQELIDYVAGFTHDPLGFVRAAWPWGVKGTFLEKHKGPRRWQCDVLSEIGEHLRRGASLKEAMQPYLSAIASGHGIGKSALVAFITLWAIATCQNTRGVVTANTEAQLRTKTWPELMKWFSSMICAHWFEPEAMSIHAKGTMAVQKAWRIDAVPWSENNTEAFAGLHNEGARLLLIFDEASAIADKVWEVSEGALTDADTEILWLVFGNPTRNSGRFRECFRKNGHRWHQRQIDSRTVEGLNLAQLQKIVDDNGEESDLVKVRIRGMFPASSAMQFIATTDVDVAFGRVIRPESYNFAPVILTCDPAWTGEDPLIIGLRQGNMFKVLRELPKNDDDVQVATILAMLQDEHKADAVFIDFGYGTGIYSAGMAMGRLGWQMVQFGAAAPNPGFVNMRAWIWDQMKQWLKQGGSIQPDHGLYTELCGPETISRLDGRVQLESKQDMKDRGLPSPNKADALAISFAFPVSKLATVRTTVAQQAVVASTASYDPLRRRR